METELKLTEQDIDEMDDEDYTIKPTIVEGNAMYGNIANILLFVACGLFLLSVFGCEFGAIRITTGGF